jgi:hypothetical protein
VSFLTEVKSGAAEVRAPYYSHMRYDIVPDASISVRRPDIVIVEGLNVLQPPPTPNDVAVSDLFDFSIYVDADAEHIAQWYVDRFLALRRGAFSNPNSFFNVFADLSDTEIDVIAICRGRGCNSKTGLFFRLRVDAGGKSEDQAHGKTCCLCHTVFQHCQKHLLSAFSALSPRVLHLKLGFGSATDNAGRRKRGGRITPMCGFPALAPNNLT